MAGRPKKQKSITSIFALRLTERMLKMDVGNEELCSKIGVKASQTISGYKSGTREPDIDKLIKIADALNTSVDYLIGRTDDPDPNPEIVKISEMTGLSSEAIDKLMIAQKDSDNEIVQNLRLISRRYAKLLSWLIINQGNSIDPDTGECLFDGLLDYFNIDDKSNIKVYRFDAETGFIPLGEFWEDELHIAKGRGLRPYNSKTMDAGTFELIKERLNTLRRVYWNQIEEQSAHENDKPESNEQDTDK